MGDDEEVKYRQVKKKMIRVRIETPSDAIFCGCWDLFLGIFVDFIILMTFGFPNAALWIVFFVTPALGISLVGLGLYHLNKGLDWNGYFPWMKKKINFQDRVDKNGENIPYISGWWKICTKCEAKVDLEAEKCPACGDLFYESDNSSEETPYC